MSFSLFGLIRCLLGVIIYLPTSFIINKRSKNVRRNSIIALLVCLILVLTLFFLPLENLFITFDSVDAAYDYSLQNSMKYRFYIPGDDCDFAIGEDKATMSYLIIPKTEEGWRVGVPAYTKLIGNRWVEDILVRVYQYKNTDNYFICVSDFDGIKLTEITDSCNTVFYEYETTLGDLEYYGSIAGFDESYVLIVDGVTIEFD